MRKQAHAYLVGVQVVNVAGEVGVASLDDRDVRQTCHEGRQQDFVVAAAAPS